MQIFKRIVGLLLCLAMVLSFVPVSHTHVHAAEPVRPGETTIKTDPVKQGRVLNIYPAKKITTVFGCYTDKTGNDESTFSDGNDGECVTDGWFGRAGYSERTSEQGKIALVMTLSETVSIGGMEITAHETKYDPTNFDVQAYVNGQWVTIFSQESNAFSSCRTVMFDFGTDTTTNKIRVLFNSVVGGSSTQCRLKEVVLYESKVGNVYNYIDMTGRGSSTDAHSSHPVTNLIDADKSNVFLATNATIDLTDEGQPTSVDGFRVYAYRTDSNPYPSKVTVSVQKTAGGSYEEIGTFNTDWSSDAVADVLDVRFNQTYDAYGIRFVFNKNVYLNGLDLLQFEHEADPNAAPVVGTPGGMQKINLTNSVVGCDSQNAATQSDYTKLTWYSTLNPGWKELSHFTDGDYTNEVHWGLDPHERADVYIDLTKNTGSAVAVDQFKLYHSTYRDVGSVYFALILADGTVVENTATLNWKQDVAADPFVYTYDQTYTAVGLYVWQPDNNPTNGIRAAFGEIELYQNQTVQLPAVTGLNTTEVTSNSITVTANNVTVSGTGAIAGDLQFSIDNGESWKTATNGSYTFTELTAGTEYTILARYEGTNGYITTKEADIVSTKGTTEAGVQQLPEPTNVSTITTDSTITVYATAAAGTLMYRVVLNEDEVRPWQTDNVFTGLDRNTSYDVEVKCVDDNYAESKVVTADGTTLPTQLSAPANLRYTEITDTSITVTADAADGILRFRINGGDWTTEPTFTGLKYSTTYKIEALYTATDMPDFSDSEVSSITVTTSSCAHAYDNACDADCNACGEIRVPADHVYADCEDTDCNECGEIRTAPGHKYTDDCDADCNECDVTREPPHKYENACDATCDCGATRVPADHVYDNACDADCNECGETRTPADHVYDNKYDADCNVCGEIRSVPEVPTVDNDLDDLTVMPELPTPQFGYYTNNNTDGIITDYYQSEHAPGKLTNNDTTDKGARSEYYLYSEIASGEKIPVILFNLGAEKTLGGIEIYGWTYSYYNIEIFDVQVYVDGAWKTVAAAYDAFVGDNRDAQFEAADASLKMRFDGLYTTSQVRILINGITDMTDYAYEDGPDDDELIYGSYFRVREIKLYEGVIICEHEYDNACDANCNLCGQTRVPSDHVYVDCEDDTCDVCGEKRTAPGHKFDNCEDTQCNRCDATREPLQHQYENACDEDCNECGAIREVGAHEYTDDCDESCNICFEEREAPHVYDNNCDTDCNNCGATREGSHIYDNDCDADCNECGYLRPDATGHKYDNECDENCNNCGFVRTAKHVYDDCDDTVCNKCSAEREPLEHVYKNECDPDCDVCQKLREGMQESHVYTDDCDSTCNKCEGHRNAPHVYDSIYDPDCNNPDCGATRTVQEKPNTPNYPDKKQLALDAPIFGYYSDRNTNGAITDCYLKDYGPDKLVDGIVKLENTEATKKNRTASEDYYYADVRQGIKIPVILFNFAEPVDVCSIDIYGYAYNYYNMETFDVQVYTDGEWLNVAHITNAFTDGPYQDQIDSEDEALTINFNQAYKATQLRILVRSITDMTGKGDIHTGDDEFGYAAQFRLREIKIYELDIKEDVNLDKAELNGVDIRNFKIVYSDDEPDYNYRAAQYIQEQILRKTGRELAIVEDNASEATYEILVGETNRSLSKSTSAPAKQQMKFTINTDGCSVAMEADYFIIAGAAYYFVENLVPDESDPEKDITEKLELAPITKEPNNYIMMIGDGMGVMQTRLFEKYGASPTTGTYGFGDGEDIFYGYYFPYEGRSRTWNVLGQMTDSAAGGTALSTGYKTTNGTIALDRYGNEIKSLTELALELGMSASVMSTEGSDGATPAAFSAHSTGRYDDEIIDQQGELEAKYANATKQKFLFVDRYISSTITPNAVYKTFTAEEWGRYETNVTNALNEMDKNEKGFFIMYEEAYIDKNQHNGPGSIENTFKTVYRFNQAIGLFMEYAMYNPDTVVLITADHETGGLNTNFGFTTPNPPDEGGYNHSTQDVPVFAYGFGMEVFATNIQDKNDLTGEVNGFYQNASIGRTFAHFMTNGHADDFGDPWYPILVKGTTLQEYPEDPMIVKKNENLNKIQINGLDSDLTDGNYTTYADMSVTKTNVLNPAVITIDLTNNGEPTNIKKMILRTCNHASTIGAPATTIVEVLTEPDGEWLQIYKDVLYELDATQTGIMDFSESYNAYKIRVTVNSINKTGGYGTLRLSEIELFGYDVKTPDVGGVVTSAGDANEDAVVKLMKGDRVAYTATITGNNYYVMNVADGDYTVVATKNKHVTAKYDITVKGEPVRQDVALKYVSTQASVGVSQSVRLIEPWAMRNFIQFGTKNEPIYLTSILGYGAYAVIEHKAGEATPDSWDDIVYNDKAICFEKSFTAGDEKISHTNLNGRNRRYNVLFDFYDMLYTYRMAEQVYWVAFYEDAEGVHFTTVNKISMSELIDKIKAEANPSDTEEAVLDDMKTLHKELIEFRGPNANLGNTPYPEGVKLSESGIVFQDINFGDYQFGKKRQIRLIEPWGFKVTLRFKSMANNTILSDPHAVAADYGMIFYHDKQRRHVENGMSYDEMLAQSDALVFSKSKNNMTVNKDAVLAVYTKDIYTYQLDTELYCLPFIKMGNQYYFPENAVRWNLLDEMIEIRDDTKDHTQAERDVFTAMVNLYYDVTKHLGYN